MVGGVGTPSARVRTSVGAEVAPYISAELSTEIRHSHWPTWAIR